MRKIRTIFVCVLCVLLLASLVPPVSAADTGADMRYDPCTEGIYSAYYTVDHEKGYIMGIAPGTTVQQLRNVCLPGELEISQETLTTGTVLTARIPAQAPSAEPVVHTLTAIVTSDLNGDGGTSITDMLMVKNRLLGQELSDTAQAAADMNHDGNVTITDFLQIKSLLLGMEQTAGYPLNATQAHKELLCLVPGETTRWLPPVDAVSLESSDETRLCVSEDGMITAGETEGAAFVYALDTEGNVVARTMVCILQEKLSVSLDADQYRLPMGGTQQIMLRVNHPVHAGVSWESSDPSVVSVDNSGMLTGHKPGTAQVCVMLTNGSTAQADVTVAPPITGLDTTKSLYKVKPGSSRTIELVLTPADVEEVFTWTSSDPSVATVEDGVVTGVTYGTATITATGLYSGLSVSCQVKVCDVKQIAITFDDGPSGYTEQLLDYLKEHDIKATFFLVGNRISDYPNTLKRQVEEGHEIGYHSYAHVEQTTLPDYQIIHEFEVSEEALKKITGAEFTLWRTPGGGYSKRVLNCIDLPHIMWSIDSYDWKVRNTYKVYANIMNQVHDGGIILVHDLYSFSVNGAIMAMDELLAGDYEFMTVTEILSCDGTPPEPNTNYFNG